MSYPILRTLVLLLSTCLLGATTRPNVLVIITDDQGWGDLSLHGNLTIETPNIDRLAEQGVQFDRFYVQPVCSPTRAELLTGRYSQRGGVYSTFAGGERLDLDETTIADVFKASGYSTGIYGKWHSGSQYPYHPLGRGFDDFYGFTSGHWGLYFSPMIEHNGEMTRGNGYLPDDCTDKALAFAGKAVGEDKPFFILLAYNTPHSPMQVPDAYWAKFENSDVKQRGTIPEKEDILHTKAALAMCENIDWNVGRIMARLSELGVEEDTIVLYMTDNGPNGERWNGGMKGRKGSVHEGGVRSPLFVRWPSTVEPGRIVREIAGVTDLLPTLADMAGIPADTRFPLDGISIKPLIMGTATDWPDRMIFANWKNRTSVRTQRYRYDLKGQLWDMEADPEQLRNVAREFPEVTGRLADAIKAFKADVNAEGIDENRPYPVGHAAFPVTQLPVRDAETHGSIERSSHHFNDTYLMHWIFPEDAVTWDVEVLSAGLYEAEIWYACREENVGVKLELSYKDAATTARITEAHDPPFLGGRYTRSMLKESPNKAFKRMVIGQIHLEAGKGQLRMSAPEIPGNEGIELRLLTLRRR
jgi:arylsulfatase A-like enzyme